MIFSAGKKQRLGQAIFKIQNVASKVSSEGAETLDLMFIYHTTIKVNPSLHTEKMNNNLHSILGEFNL